MQSSEEHLPIPEFEEGPEDANQRAQGPATGQDNVHKQDTLFITMTSGEQHVLYGSLAHIVVSSIRATRREARGGLFINTSAEGRILLLNVENISSAELVSAA